MISGEPLPSSDEELPRPPPWWDDSSAVGFGELLFVLNEQTTSLADKTFAGAEAARAGQARAAGRARASTRWEAEGRLHGQLEDWCSGG